MKLGISSYAYTWAIGVSDNIYHKMGYTIEVFPCGEGMLNIETLLKKVSKRCDSALLEQWVPPELKLECTVRREDEWAKKSISYLKNFFE